MSPPTTPAGSLSTFAPTAEIRVLYHRGRPWSKYKSVNILFASRIYWKKAKKDVNHQPQSLLDFRSANSLELVRLAGNDNWKEVDEMVMVDSHEGRPRITVRGHLHGRTRRKTLFLVRDVRIEIMPNTCQQQEVWVKRVQALIAPWNLLQKQVRDATSRGPSAGAEELEIAVGGLTASTVTSNQSSISTENKWGDNLVYLPEQIQKLSIVDDLTAHGTAVVETGAALTKLVASVERVSETAEFMADVSKCVAGVSTVFQLVGLSAQVVSMCAEANRGRRVLPVALGRVVILLRYVLESLGEIMKPSGNANELDKEFVLNVLKQTVCTMDMAETQLLRGRGSQIMNAEDVKEVERKIEQLEPLVVTVRNTSRICAVGEEMTQLKVQEIGSDGLHHMRPSVSAFFSGRKKELKALKDILEKWGSAVVTQYGGAGKTELMIAFADRAERDGEVPGGVFWVTVDGGEKDVIGSLAGLAEKLTQRKMSEDERRNGTLVVASLEQGLGKRQGRWLLGLDNADDSKVRGILNEVCGLAGPSGRNGWVVVTSRQGQPHVWDRMKREQKLNLDPLCTGDAMVALWRQIRKMETADADDDIVMKEIKELEGGNEAEYRALKKLCGDDSGEGLGGLPLALVQAGSFIAQFEYSFGEYLDLFESANKEDWENVMNKTEEVKPIQDSQRSIWTTWKISVQKLSEKACMVLRAMAMLGQGGIREALVKGILKAVTATEDGSGSVKVMFQNVVMKELMHGSSLIWRDKGEGKGEERWMYSMHRLVRRFILNDMGRGSVMWMHMYSVALPAVREVVKTELEKESKSFKVLPDVFEKNHRELSTHSLALVHHYVLPGQGTEVRDVSQVKDIHQYSGRVMQFMGKLEEEAQVWEQLLDILHHQQAENGRRSSDKGLSGVLHQENRGKEAKSLVAGEYDSLGSGLEATEELNSAVSKLEGSPEMGQAVHGHDKPHDDIAKALSNLGLVYYGMGKLDRAVEKCEQSLNMYQAIHGHEPHDDIALSLNNLGLVYRKMGKLDKALENCEQGLEMYRAVHGNNKPHHDFAKALNFLGVLYFVMGKLQKALEKCEQSLDMYRAVHGNNKPHHDIASSLGNLGLVYCKMGKLDKALEMHEQSHDMYTAIHGRSKPHHDIAMSLNNLGNVYWEMDELDKGLEKYEQSLDLYRAVHGHNKPHHDIAITLSNLGLVYYGMGKLDKALEKYEQSLDMYTAVHGHNKPHHDIALALNNLGSVYREMGKLDKALEKHEQSLDMYIAIHGRSKPHHDIALSLNNIGNVYLEMGELDKGLEKYEQGLDLCRAVHGHDKPHRSTAFVLWHIGFIHHRQKNLNRAAEFLEDSLEMLRIVRGRNSSHSDIMGLVSSLASVYEDQGRENEALARREGNTEIGETSGGELSNRTIGK